MAAATSFPLDDSSPLRTQTPPPNSICLHPSTSLAARKVMRPSLQGALSQNQCISRICFFEMPSPNLPPPPRDALKYVRHLPLRITAPPRTDRNSLPTLGTLLKICSLVSYVLTPQLQIPFSPMQTPSLLEAGSLCKKVHQGHFTLLGPSVHHLHKGQQMKASGSNTTTNPF